MKIRTAHVDDFKRIEPLLLEVEHHHARLEPEIFQAIDGYDCEHFNDLVANEYEVLFYAEINHEVAGVLIAVEREFPPLPLFVGGKFVVVEELSVTERFRRKGVAKALMAAAEEWARSRGVQHMQLSVWEKNTVAIALYESLDYKPKLIRYYKDL